MKTYKDIYKFPLHLAKYGGNQVFDEDETNFVFQFQGVKPPSQMQLVVNVINGETNLVDPDTFFHHEHGYIKDNKGREIILIRGWGNLTGVGGHNLPEEEAANIQDTFAEYIVERLNYRKNGI